MMETYKEVDLGDGKTINYSYYKSGKLRCIDYRRNHADYREEGNDFPTTILYYENGNVEYEEFCNNGCRNREYFPSIIEYYENGKVKEEKYYKRGYLHCVDDHPSVVYYDIDGNVEGTLYHNIGCLASFDFMEETKKRRKNKDIILKRKNILKSVLDEKTKH